MVHAMREDLVLRRAPAQVAECAPSLPAAAAATRVAELDPPGRDGLAVGPGVWETSGIIDASALFGADTWLSDRVGNASEVCPAASFMDSQVSKTNSTDIKVSLPPVA